MKNFLLTGTLALALATPACAQELEVGVKAPGFTLVNAVDGKSVTFKPGDGKTHVVIFTCNHCPYSKAFESRILDVAKTYSAKGITFYAVNPNDEVKQPEDSIENMKQRAIERNYTLPYLRDADSSIARAYGARVTPHVFVVDGKGNIAYRGYVDDSAKSDERKDTALTNALDSMIAGKPVAVSQTKAFGCSIKWKSKA